MSHSDSIGALVLAAGSSSRLGRPKQLIDHGGEPLLARLVSVIRDIKQIKPIIVVLGAHADTILDCLEIPDTSGLVNCIENKEWNQGMGNSLSFGMRYLQEKFPNLQHVLVSVCDQPLLDAGIFRKLATMSGQHPEKIVACAYSDTLGPPVVFPWIFFDRLMALSGDRGAKRIILENVESVIPVAFPHGAIDLDTSMDLDNFDSISNDNRVM